MARQKRQTKASVHYVNNKEFTAAIVVHNEACKVAITNEEDKPRVSEYIGECIYKIATRLSTKPNFINYSYRDEMICDGIENCLQYINNFNPFDKAGAYGIQDWIGKIGIKSIEGSYSNVVGLPTDEVYQQLKLFI